MGILVTCASGFVVVAVLGVLLHRRGTTIDEARGRENLHTARMDTSWMPGGDLPPGGERPKK